MTWLMHRPDREAHAISDYWDRLVRQQPALPVPPPDLPASQGALLRQLHAEEELASTPAYRDELLERLLATYGETASMTSTTVGELSQPAVGPRDSGSLLPRSRNAVTDGIAPHSAGSTGHVSVPAGRRERSTRSRFDRLATGAMALVLVVAIGGGAWLVADRTSFGGGDDLPPNSMSGAVPEVTIEPGQHMSTTDWSGNDCDAKAPTWDWVYRHLDDARSGYGSEYVRYTVPIRPSQAEIDAMIEVHDRWVACLSIEYPAAYRFQFQTPNYTRQSFLSAHTDGRIYDMQLRDLTDLAMTPQNSDSTPEVMLDDRSSGSTTVTVHPGLPIPPGATPVEDPIGDVMTGLVPVFLGDGIQIIGPDRAQALIYWIDPATNRIQIGGVDGWVVGFRLVDGHWLIDRYGPAGMG